MKLANRILQVNHAGEHGAVNIYAGQLALAKFTAQDLLTELNEFQTHERSHRALFQAELARRQIRPCLSYALCGYAGYGLGLLSAMLGRSAIAATSYAVEHVVLQHLQQQLVQLKHSDKQAYHTVHAIIADEQAHHDRAASQINHRHPVLRLYISAVSAITEIVIWLGMRL